ncbi:MAG: hypothetical protein CMO42_01185 [Verrucomicrobiales bacterium]|nr:hypothetical protein [Verrucomicrobiales bacterium]|tara:strand:+ start:6272 stop:8449 length:2178 start_codon:yes stop_codon:yes gene_type:complete
MGFLSIVKGEVSFTRDVMPVLSKAGCNGGGCHGNQNGKGGFKLSLWGENPTLDHKNILSSEKRANPSNPEVSKLLRKPTLLEKHEGDKRFDLESEEYRILHDWLKLGAKNDIDSAPQLESIRIIPSSVLLSAPNKKINLQVKAKFSNGEEKDVSQWAVYESANLGAEVSAGGELEFSQPGETTVFVRYMGGRASMRAALIKANDNYKWKGPSPKNEIDHYVFSKLKLFNQNPSAVSDDLTFLRRVSLDVTGSLPSSDTARSFLSDKRKDKRSILIEELLKSEEYASFWALKWADLLRVEEKTLDSKGVEKIYGWLKEMIGSGKPLDQFTKDILCATGSTYNNPPANFYRALRAPVNRAEAVAQVFIGTRINCAKCHDHPFENVRQDDYYRFAAIFDAIDYEIIENKRKDGFDKHRFVGEQVIKLVSADKFQNKFLKDPRTKKPPEPGFLDPSSGPIKSFDNRLEEVADWITSHPRFAKVQANRIWSNLVGQPLVDPIDDVRETNPASNPELLQFLSKELIESGFDQKHLIRLITNSITYQLSSDPGLVLNVGTDLTFARAKVMRYPAEVIIDAAHKSMSIEGEFSDSFKSKYAITMPGVDSVHLSKNPHENDKFLKIFGKPARLTNSDAERSNETTLAQVFELTAGKTLNTILSHQENKIGQLLKNGKDDLEIIDELYWSILTRPPVDEEWSAFLSYLNLSSNRRSALEDVAWSLLNAKEFLLRR